MAKKIVTISIVVDTDKRPEATLAEEYFESEVYEAIDDLVLNASSKSLTKHITEGKTKAGSRYSLIIRK